MKLIKKVLGFERREKKGREKAKQIIIEIERILEQAKAANKRFF